MLKFVKMHPIVGILTFMSLINLMFSLVEHEKKKFYRNLGTRKKNKKGLDPDQAQYFVWQIEVQTFNKVISRLQETQPADN